MGKARGGGWNEQEGEKTASTALERGDMKIVTVYSNKRQIREGRHFLGSRGWSLGGGKG